MSVEERLEDLATQLRESRLRGNKADLDWVLEQAGILKRAKELAKGAYGRWLREQAHMDWTTANRYTAVSKLVRENYDDRHKIATLSLAKTYVLAGLATATARGLLQGSILLSKPIKELSEIRFRAEVRRRFGRRPRTPRIKIIKQVLKLLHEAARTLSVANPRRLTPAHKKALAAALADLRRMIAALPVAA